MVKLIREELVDKKDANSYVGRELSKACDYINSVMMRSATTDRGLITAEDSDGNKTTLSVEVVNVPHIRVYSEFQDLIGEFDENVADDDLSAFIVSYIK